VSCVLNFNCDNLNSDSPAGRDPVGAPLVLYVTPVVFSAQARPVATRQTMSSGLIHCDIGSVIKSYVNCPRTDHGLRQWRNDQIMSGAVDGQRDDEGQTEDRVRQSGLNHHRGNGGIRPSVV
jgi:hypothetical protein